MAKLVTVLGLEGTTLRGVGLVADGGRFSRAAEDSWPLVAAADLPGADGGDGEASGEEVPTQEVAQEDRPLARAFRAAAARFGSREFTLSLPLSMMLVKTVRLPAEARDDLLGAAQMELDSISPFPDEVLSPGAEVLFETDREIVAVMAALPDAASAEISEALAAAKVRVTRTDAAALGWMRSLWPRICEKEGASLRIVLLNLCGGWDLLVIEDGSPSFMRGIGEAASPEELAREVTLSLLQLGGAGDADDVVVCSRGHVDDATLSRLGAFGPVREVLVDDDFGGVNGVALRAVEGATFDVTPAAWREALAESRFRRRLSVWLAVAGALWLVLMGVLFGVDATYDFMTDQQKAKQRDKRHAAAFKEVSALKSRVELIQKYADHAHGALEVLKTVSDALPPSQDMMFGSFKYKRDESVRVAGTATAREDLRTFMDNLNEASFEDAEEGERLFSKVQQSGGENVNKKGAIRFTMEGFFHVAEEEAPAKSKGKKKGGAK